MGSVMSNSKSEAGTSSITLDMDLLIKDFKTHLHSLEGAALSITSSTSAQYELVQNFLNGKEALTQPITKMGASSCTEVTSQSLNGHEKRVLAFIQDDICVQATVIKNIVTHLKALGDASDNTKSQVHQFSSTIEKGSNKSRLDLNYLRAQAKEQKKKFEETERQIDKLSKEMNVAVFKAEGPTDSLLEPKKERIQQRGSGNLNIPGANVSSSSTKNKGKNNLSKLSKFEDEMAIKNIELNRVMEETVQKDREIKMIKEEMKKKVEELQMKEEEIAALKTEIKGIEQSTSEESSFLLNEIKDKKCDNDTLKAKLKEKKSEISDMMIKIGDMETLTAEINQMTRKFETANRRQQQYSYERDNAKRQNSELEITISRLNNDIRTLRRDKEIALEKMRQRRKVSVMLYTPRRGDLLNTVAGELKTMLTQQFDAQQEADLTVVECENASQIEPNKPVLVVCINASRLGTDVTNALTGIRGSSQVAVVILHHKEIHALPNQSSERVLTSQEYKALGGIIDMAFLSSRGLYPCEMNKAAVTTLMDFIRQKNIQ